MLHKLKLVKLEEQAPGKAVWCQLYLESIMEYLVKSWSME